MWCSDHHHQQQLQQQEFVRNANSVSSPDLQQQELGEGPSLFPQPSGSSGAGSSVRSIIAWLQSQLKLEVNYRGNESKTVEEVKTEKETFFEQA